jgi:hypothetical protein
MLLSAVSVLVVAQSSSEVPEGLMNNPVYKKVLKYNYTEIATKLPRDVTWSTAIIFTRYSTASCIRNFFILRANHLLLSSTGMPPSGCTISYFILDAQLFLQPQLLPHKEHTDTVCIICSMFSCFFGLSTYVTENTVLRNNVKRSINSLVTTSTEVRLTQSHKGVK